METNEILDVLIKCVTENERDKLGFILDSVAIEYKGKVQPPSMTIDIIKQRLKFYNSRASK